MIGWDSYNAVYQSATSANLILFYLENDLQAMFQLPAHLDYTTSARAEIQLRYSSYY